MRDHGFKTEVGRIEDALNVLLTSLSAASDEAFKQGADGHGQFYENVSADVAGAVEKTVSAYTLLLNGDDELGVPALEDEKSEDNVRPYDISEAFRRNFMVLPRDDAGGLLDSGLEAEQTHDPVAATSTRRALVERHVVAWGGPEPGGCAVYLDSDDFVLIDAKTIREMALACNIFRERLDAD